MPWQVRIAPSLGDGFAGHPNDIWGTVPYTNPNEPCVFFGMYGMPDLQAFWAHTGRKAILWAGSDIRNFLKGYWLDKHGSERIDARGIAKALVEAEHFVENTVEELALVSVGIRPWVVPSFLGNVNDFQPQKIDSKLRYYTSVSGEEYTLYGWDEIDGWAKRMPDTEFHLYGNRDSYPFKEPNVFVHGRVSQEIMNEQTKTMTGAIRLTRFDGFSEILAKSVLWGQKPISPYIYYPWLHNREELLSVINDYPWNAKKH